MIIATAKKKKIGGGGEMKKCEKNEWEGRRNEKI